MGQQIAPYLDLSDHLGTISLGIFEKDGFNRTAAKI